MFLLCAFLNLLLLFLNAAALPTAISDTTFKSPILSFNPDDGYIFIQTNDEKEEEIEAYGFLKQIEGLASLLSKISTCSKLASEPLLSNLKIIKSALEKEYPQKATEVVSLVKFISYRSDAVAVREATWQLFLSLKFTTSALRNNLDEHVEISEAFRQSYESILATNHNFIIKGLARVTNALN